MMMARLWAAAGILVFALIEECSPRPMFRRRCTYFFFLFRLLQLLQFRAPEKWKPLLALANFTSL